MLAPDLGPIQQPDWLQPLIEDKMGIDLEEQVRDG